MHASRPTDYLFFTKLVMTPSTAKPADIAPIKFSLHRAAKPDVCLQALGQTFHVHSLVLKSQSEFFYTYLDSPDKKKQTGSTAQFAYQWFTKVDSDGTWSLIAQNDNVSRTTSVKHYDL
jgi:hypothetical protein